MHYFSTVHVLILVSHTSSHSSSLKSLPNLLPYHLPFGNMMLPLPTSFKLQFFNSFALFLLSALAYAFTFFYCVFPHSVPPNLLRCNSKCPYLSTFLMLLIWLKYPQIIYHFLSAMGSWIYSTKNTFYLSRLSSFTCSTASISPKLKTQPCQFLQQYSNSSLLTGWHFLVNRLCEIPIVFLSSLLLKSKEVLK